MNRLQQLGSGYINNDLCTKRQQAEHFSYLQVYSHFFLYKSRSATHPAKTPISNYLNLIHIYTHGPSNTYFFRIYIHRSILGSMHVTGTDSAEQTAELHTLFCSSCVKYLHCQVLPRSQYRLDHSIWLQDKKSAFLKNCPLSSIFC